MISKTLWPAFVFAAAAALTGLFGCGGVDDSTSPSAQTSSQATCLFCPSDSGNPGFDAFQSASEDHFASGGQHSEACSSIGCINCRRRCPNECRRALGPRATAADQRACVDACRDGCAD